LNNDHDIIKKKKYKYISKEFKKFYQEHIGDYAIFKSFDYWIRVTREKIVKIENAFDDFVRFAVIDKDGNVKYYECCNYLTIYNNDEQLTFI